MPRRIPTYRPPSLAPDQGDPETERRRRYQRERTDQAFQRFYQSKRWRRFRKWFLARQPLCIDCEAAGRLKEADQLHHVVKLKDDWSRRLDPTNVVGLCRSCHSKRTARGE
ncbi:HNH endonuclease [Planctomycetes bacterium Pan216]|uniref:Putative HNH nuclease YajD n=1 Tax=Kolteria novifilia TaxID=2527975 RepID=A0A518B5B4_9BACT|nr:HNH endonuclease [Planctomycetes bacterium Pan216]